MKTTLKLKLTLALFFLISLTGFSQPAIEWQKSLGGSSTDRARSVQQTADGGYIVTGESASNDGDVTGNQGDSDFWVVKLDQLGVIEWQRSLGGSDLDDSRSVQQTLDGGYIVSGSSRSTDGDVTGHHGSDVYPDYWVVKLDPSGNIEWEKSLGGSFLDTGRSIQQTSDGGYIVVGTSYSNNGDVTGNHGLGDYWAVKLDSGGTIEWQKSLGGSNIDVGFPIQQTLDDGYIVAGYSRSIDGDVTGNHGDWDNWVLKLTATGVIEWQNSLGGSGDDRGYSVLQTLEGGYIVAGVSDSMDGDVIGNHGGRDAWVVKLNSSGVLEWQRSLGGSEEDSGLSIQQTIDGGYIVAGASNSTDGDVTGNLGGYDYWVVKLDSVGAIEWQKSLGGSGIDGATSVQQTLDGGFVVAGSSQSNDGDVTGNHGGYDYWIVKLSAELGIDENKINDLVVLSPNPNTGRFSLEFSEEIEITSIKVFDALGKVVFSETNIPSGTFEIDQNFTSGVYFVNVVSHSSETTIKMIVE